MAKKKTKGRARATRRKKASSFVSSMRKLVVGCFAAVVCMVAALFIYDWLSARLGSRLSEDPSGDREKIAAPAPGSRKGPKEKGKKSPASVKEKRSSTYTFPAGTEIPRLTGKRTEQIIRHEGYTVSYNSDYKIANWVAYELTASEAKSKKSERSNKFSPDPQVKGATATNEDYTRTGYDRGHLAPAGDMKWSGKAMRESFYFSNICPQRPGLNRGVWKDLEEQARLWAAENGSLLIVAGPVITDDLRRLGKHRVGVPKLFYKVLCYVSEGKPQGVGFLFENKDYGDTPLSSLMLPIDKVEEIVGVDFFYSLPDSVENLMEKSVDKNYWSF